MLTASPTVLRLREELLHLVGAVSQRLGALLNQAQSLGDADRTRVTRVASEIAGLQSSILDALNSQSMTTAAAIGELYDLEVRALGTIEQVEAQIQRAARVPHHTVAAQYTYHQPASAPPPRPPEPERFWPAYGISPPMRQDAAYIDVEAVPVHPHVANDGEMPLPLVPAFHMPQAGTGEALRHAVSELHAPGAPLPYGHVAYHGNQPVSHHQWPGGAYSSAARQALVPQPPFPVPVVQPGAAYEDRDPIRERFTQRLIDILESAFAPLKGSPLKLGLAAASAVAVVFMTGLWSGSPSNKPQAPASLPPRAALAEAQNPVGLSEGKSLPSRLSPLSAAAPRVGFKGDLFVPVIATVSSRAEIDQRLAEIGRSHPAILSSPVHVEPIQGSDGRPWYRAYLLPGRSRADIRELCQSLRQAGHVQCWSMRLKTS